MKVRLTLVLDMDEEAWANEYGIDPTRKREIRADIKTWATSQITGSIHADDGIIRAVEEC